MDQTSKLPENYSQLRLFSLFIGNPRSGSTLVGQILNAHPEVIISSEADILTKYYNNEIKVEEIFDQIIKRDSNRSKHDKFMSAGYDYRIKGAWQHGAIDLKVIGDKKQSKNAKIIHKNTDLLYQIENKLNLQVRLISTVRHPLDNLATILSKSELDTYTLSSTKPFIEYFFRKHKVVHRIQTLGDHPIHILKLEELINSPEQCIKNLCEFFDIKVIEQHIEACKKIIFAESNITRSKIPWTNEMLDEIEKECLKIPFLASYYT